MVSSSSSSRRRQKHGRPSNHDNGGPPVTLPHDGPVYRAWQRWQQHERSSDLPMGSVDQAMRIVQTLLVESSSDPSVNDDSNSMAAAARQLVATLQAAPHLHAQLQALRQHGKSEQRKPHSPCRDNNKDLHQLLLEWMLSTETPSSLRRCIASYLKANFATCNDNDNKKSKNFENTITKNHTVHQAVLSSLLVSPPKGSSDTAAILWEDVRHSLLEALHYPPLVQSQLLLPQSTATNESFPCNATTTATVDSQSFMQRQQPKQPQQQQSVMMTRVLEFLQRQAVRLTPALQRMSPQQVPPSSIDNGDSTETVKASIQLVLLVDKTLLLWSSSLSSNTTTASGPPPVRLLQRHGILDDCQQFVWSLLACPLVPLDSLAAIGVCHGRILQPQFEYDSSAGAANNHCESGQSSLSLSESLITKTLKKAREDLSELPEVAVLQGLAAVVPLLDSIDGGTSVLAVLEHATTLAAGQDPDTRVGALKSVHALLSRVCKQRQTRGAQRTMAEAAAASPLLAPTTVRLLAHRALDIVWHAWENPPTRQLANAIPSIFQTILDVLMSLYSSQESLPPQSSASDTIGDLDNVVQTLLNQSVHRKGRYLGLEICLNRKVTTAKALLVGSDREKNAVSSVPTLLDDLLAGMADHGHNTGVMADLWVKLLRQLLLEMKEDRNVAIAESEGHQPSHMSTPTEANSTNKPDVLNLWLAIWVPSLAQALISKFLSRRKQVAAFLLPRLMSTQSSIPADEMAHAFNALLRNVSALSHSKTKDLSQMTISLDRETLHDRVDWAQLEIIRLATSTGSSGATLLSKVEVCATVAQLMPAEKLLYALTHGIPTLRLAALQIMQNVVAMYNRCNEQTTVERRLPNTMKNLLKEADLWRKVLPYAMKTDGKEYISSVLVCLIGFLDRLLHAEAASKLEQGQHGESIQCLPVFRTFVIDFLVNDIFIKQTAYPGTVALKESFSLALLECLVVFSSRTHPLVLASKLLPKTSVVLKRKRSKLEEESIQEVQQALLDENVLSALLYSLLHSIWDSTRASAYNAAIALVRLGGISNNPLPSCFTEPLARERLEARGLFLASSPRQREADTGARLLAFFYASTDSDCSKESFFGRLVHALDNRLVSMKTKLEAILGNEDDILTGRELPLANGIILAFKLILDLDSDILQSKQDKVHDMQSFNPFSSLSGCFCKAIRISLAVVADVKDGVVVEGLENEITPMQSNMKKPAERSVNPGAIGANGIFSSVNRTDAIENSKRLASQRIVVGSWLLTRETCAAVASLLSLRHYQASKEEFDEIGVLLISTLTSLKHTGAAFAAHRALQQVSLVCFRSQNQEIVQLPAEWAERILREVSMPEKIKDSTLRRSLGYSLGFLSIMRSQISSGSSRAVCQCVLLNLVRYSLPSISKFEQFLKAVDLPVFYQPLFLSSLSNSSEHSVVADEEYNLRTRVHALNALRLMLLDAPLATEVFPFVGIAITASVAGYTDSEWSVRNSSTMLFAAAMLRSIDPNKNASHQDLTSSNAITAQELFQAYPSLADFLVAVLKAGVKGVFEEKKFSLPPVLPILLLLARVQSVEMSGLKSIVLVEPFVPLVRQCLGHKCLSIRKGAASALRNISSTSRNSPTFIDTIVIACRNDISLAVDCKTATYPTNFWNRLHGALLAIHELVEVSDRAQSLVRDQPFMSDLHSLLEVVNESIVAPPDCLTTAFKILFAVSTFLEHDMLLDLLFSSCRWLGSMAVRREDTAGCSGLSSALGSITTKILVARLWNSQSTKEVNDKSIDELTSILLSKNFAIRVSAIKTFKKSLYEATDMLKDSEGGVVGQVIALLLSCLHAEIRRDATTGLTMGSHIPSLRRLTRCLIECMNAIDGSVDASYAVLRVECITVAAMILMQEKMDCPDSLTSLQGNATEILSFACLSQDDRRKGNLTPLRSMITRLSDPSGHWRLRHSAAIALQKGNMLHMDNASNFESTHQVADDSDAQSMVRTIGVWESLMQDDDVDVRFAAARAIPNQVGNHASELALLRGFITVEALLPSDAFAAFLVSRLSTIVDGLDLTFHTIFEEFNQGESAGGAVADADRKIFEEESQNSYLEVCLTAQLAARSVSQIVTKTNHTPTPDVSFDCTKSAATVFLDASTRILSELQPHVYQHHMTRHNLIFPALHSMLLGSLALLGWQTAETTTSTRRHKLQDVAKEITAVGLDKKGTLHPCVRDLLQELADWTSDRTNEELVKRVADCCFLIPSNMTVLLK